MDVLRALRVLMLFTTALATPLLVTTSIIARFLLWWFAFFPLFFTAMASIVSLWHHRRNGCMPDFRYTLIDLLAALSYLGLLLPIWATGIGHLIEPGFGLLAGYTTAPMIVNMFAHTYIFLCHAKSVRTWMSGRTVHDCPKCHNKFTNNVPQVQETIQRSEGYSLLRGEDYLDNDAIAYSDGRPSEDQIGAHGAHDAADVESKGKGAITI